MEIQDVGNASSFHQAVALIKNFAEIHGLPLPVGCPSFMTTISCYFQQMHQKLLFTEMNLLVQNHNHYHSCLFALAHLIKTTKSSKSSMEKVQLGKQSITEMLSLSYSFDHAQQIHYPSNPLQPGPLYFKTPRKCGVFGVSNHK